MHNVKLITFLLLVLLTACSKNKQEQKDQSDITGTWYLITNDSVYDEAIFTRNHFWAWSERSGQLYGKYKVKNDSFKYLQLNDQLMRALSYKRTTEDEFEISDAGFKSHYYRLNISLDTSSLINGRDMKLMDSYMAGLRRRKLTWSGDYRKGLDHKLVGS
ncbi:MAG: hypothetical protein WDN75_13160 [Bacteroidota bacterium]